MIVEFVGVTGAGKTTLARSVGGRHGSGRVVTVEDLLLDHFVLRNITHPTLRNLLFDIFGLPFFLLSLRRTWPFTVYAVRRLTRNGSTYITTLNYIRSVIRRVGIHELLMRRYPKRIVLVDEGTVLSSYLLFVYSGGNPTAEDLLRFSKLVPVPRGVVYVKAPVETLLERARARQDPRRELASVDAADVRRLIGRADALFDALVEVAPWRERVLTVENYDLRDMSLLVDAVCEFTETLDSHDVPPDPQLPLPSQET